MGYYDRDYNEGSSQFDVSVSKQSDSGREIDASVFHQH